MKKAIYFLIGLILVSIYLNGQSWSPVGSGMNGKIYSLYVYNNELYAGGSFTIAGNITTKSIAKWDGFNWSDVGGGMNQGYVSSFATYYGELYAGGVFDSAGSVASQNIAKWNGTQWYYVPCSNFICPYSSMENYQGSLFMGGHVVSHGNAAGIASWDGVTTTIFVFVNTNLLNYAAVSSLYVYNNELYAAGHFTSIGTTPNANDIAKWNGTTWSAVGAGMSGRQGGNIYSLKEFNGELYAAGRFDSAGGIPAKNIAKWNGTIWSAVGAGIDSVINCLEVYDSELYAGGYFSNAGGVPANKIAKWNGQNWSSVGTGTDSMIYAMAVYDSMLYVGGNFLTAGNQVVNNIARWNNATGLFEDIGGGGIQIRPNMASDKMIIDPNNNVILEMKLFDTEGKEISNYSECKDQPFEMDVSKLNESIYFLRIKTSKGVITKKIVVQR